MLNLAEVASQVNKVLAEKFGEEIMDLGLDEPLSASGLDSVDMLDALAALEKYFEVAFEREELVGISTREELYQVVYEQVTAG